MPSIDLTPTPAGVRHIRRVFEETMKESRRKESQADAMLGRIDEAWNDGKAVRFTDEEHDLVVQALEALIEIECQRQVSMQDGIDECDKDTRTED